MRYVLAIVFAVIVALGASMFVAPDVASWVVARQSFDSPDDVADRHVTIFMAVNIAALALGWCIGWALGALLERPEQPL